MKQVFNFILCLSMAFSPTYATANVATVTKSGLFDVFSTSKAGGAGEVSGTKFSQLLRDQGFDDASISFALDVARGRVDVHHADSISKHITTAAGAHVRELEAALKSSGKIIGWMKAGRFAKGSIVGAIALALIILEGQYAVSKTEKNFESLEDAYATNFARVAVATGSATLAMDQLSRKGLGHKVAGLAFLTACAYATLAGTGQIAMEQMDYVTTKKIEEAGEVVLQLKAEIEQARGGSRDERNQLLAEKNSLIEERAKVFTPAGIPQGLTEQRDQLQAELDKQILQLEAYSVNIKAGSPQLDYAEELREKGFTHVGVYADGDASNDKLYRETLLPKTEAAIADTRRKLQPVLEQIEKLALQESSPTLSSSDQDKIRQIDANISALTARISELAEDDEAVLALTRSYNKAVDYATALRAQNIDANTNLMEKFSQFLNTQEGYNSLVYGSLFGILSVLGGVVLHKALEIWMHKGYIPSSHLGSVRLAGIDILNLKDRDYLLRISKELKVQRRFAKKNPTGFYNAFVLEAVSSVERSFKTAVDLGVEMKAIDADKASKAFEALHQSSRLVYELPELNPLLPDRPSGIENAGKLKASSAHPVVDDAVGKSKAARVARIGGNAPVLGVAIAGGAAALTLSASKAQARAADYFAQTGGISSLALEKYSSDVQQPCNAIFMGDIALSLADPTFITLPLTLVAEGACSSKMKAWLNSYAPHLSQSNSDVLSPSLISGDTISTEVTDTLRSSLPRETQGYASLLHPAIISNQALVEFFRNNPRPSSPMMAPQSIVIDSERKRQVWQAQFDSYKEVLLADLFDLISDRDNLPVYLGLFSIEKKMKILNRLVVSDQDIREGTSDFDTVASYAQYISEQGLQNDNQETASAQSSGLIGWISDKLSNRSARLELEQQLVDQPELVDAYIIHRMSVGL